MYVLTKEKEIVKFPYTLVQLKQDNPTVSFPKSMSEEMLAGYGVYFVELGPAHDYDIATQNCIANDLPVYENEKWVLHSTVVEKTEEEKTNYAIELTNMIRHQRDTMLADSDWTQLLDSPLPEGQKELWKVYRQALRDITDQDGFPLSVEWPVLDN